MTCCHTVSCWKVTLQVTGSHIEYKMSVIVVVTWHMDRPICLHWILLHRVLQTMGVNCRWRKKIKVDFSVVDFHLILHNQLGECDQWRPKEKKENGYLEKTLIWSLLISYFLCPMFYFIFSMTYICTTSYVLCLLSYVQCLMSYGLLTLFISRRESST